MRFELLGGFLNTKLWIRNMYRMTSIEIAIVALMTIGGFIALSGCQRLPDNIKADIKKLEKSEAEIQGRVNTLREENQVLEADHNRLKDDVNVMKAMAEGRQIRYILKLRLEQKRQQKLDEYDADASLKDQLNAVVFKIDVSRHFYNSVSVGDVILDKFRQGSFQTEGTSSSWHISVVEKQKEIGE